MIDEDDISARDMLGLDEDNRDGRYVLAAIAVSLAMWFGLIWCVYGLAEHILRAWRGG